MPASPRRLLVFALAWTLLLAATPESSRAEVAKWNQDRAAKIAVELANEVNHLRDQVRKVPGQNYGTLQEKARKRLMDTLRVIKNEARHLAAELQAGASQEDTLPIYERLGVLVADARESANRIFLPEPVLAALNSAGVSWSKLTPYYDPDWNKAPSGSKAE